MAWRVWRWPLLAGAWVMATVYILRDIGDWGLFVVTVAMLGSYYVGMLGAWETEDAE